MSNVALNTKVPRRFQGNPLLEFIAQKEIHNLQQVQKLDQLESRLSDLHGVVAKLGAEKQIKVPPLSKPKEAPSLSQKLSNFVRNTSSGILKYLEQYFTGPQDDIPECDKLVAPFPPKTAQPEDILASIRSYADAPDTETDYFTGVGLKEDSTTLKSIYESKKAELLNLVISNDVTEGLLEKMPVINQDEITRLMDLLHCILFDCKMALPENLINIGVKDEKELESVTKTFTDYLQGNKSSVPKELASLFGLADFSKKTLPNRSFSSALVLWTFFHSIVQFQKSTNKSLSSFQEILENNFYSLLKMKQAVKPKQSEIKPKMDYVTKKLAFEELEKFIDETLNDSKFKSASIAFNEYFKAKPDLAKFIKTYRVELIIDKLKQLRDDLAHEEEPGVDDPRTTASSTGIKDADLSQRDLLKEEGLKNLLPIIYFLVTFSLKSKLELDKAYADSYDDRKVDEGKTKRELAQVNLDNFLSGFVNQSSLERDLALSLSDLLHDYVLIEDANYQQQEIQGKLQNLVGKYKLK